MPGFSLFPSQPGARSDLLIWGTHTSSMLGPGTDCVLTKGKNKNRSSCPLHRGYMWLELLRIFVETKMRSPPPEQCMFGSMPLRAAEPTSSPRCYPKAASCHPSLSPCLSPPFLLPHPTTAGRDQTGAEILRSRCLPTCSAGSTLIREGGVSGSERWEPHLGQGSERK